MTAVFRRWVGLVLLLAVLAALAVPGKAQGAVEMPFASPVVVVLDGRIAPNEYPSSFRDTPSGLEVYLVHDDVNMTVGVVSPGIGWVGVGFGPEGVAMDGANILIGYVAGGTTVLSDEYGVGFDHVTDVSLGGRDDILAFAGGEQGGRTTIEFRFPLNTGDAFDARLEPGRTYGIILAYAATADDLVTQHDAAVIESMTVGENPNRVPTKIAGLSVSYEGTPLDGLNVTLLADVRGEDGTPMSKAVVEFYLNSSVGPGLLGESQTTDSGPASMNYTLRSPGTYRFTIRYIGDADYLPQEANLSLSVSAAEVYPPLLTLEAQVLLVVFAVLASVGVAYAYVVGQIFMIRRHGKRSGSLAESGEKRPTEATSRSHPGELSERGETR